MLGHNPKITYTSCDQGGGGGGGERPLDMHLLFWAKILILLLWDSPAPSPGFLEKAREEICIMKTKPSCHIPIEEGLKMN